MARLTWKVEVCELQAFVNEGTKEKPALALVFKADMRKLFPSCESFNEQQRFTIQYGIKQKLSDSTARPKDQTLNLGEIKTVLKDTWVGLCDGSLLKRERAARGPSVDLAAAVRGLRLAGLGDEAIATALSRGIEVIKAIV